LTRKKNTDTLHAITFYASMEEDRDVIKSHANKFTGISERPEYLLSHQSPNRNLDRYQPCFKGNSSNIQKFFEDFLKKTQDLINKI